MKQNNIDSKKLEKTHQPVIELPRKIKKRESFKIKIKVGILTHPMEKNHHLAWIELFAGPVTLGRKDLELGDKPEAEFEITLEHKIRLRAASQCNLHGLWQVEKEVRVIDN
jgi:superoxide reductase